MKKIPLVLGQRIDPCFQVKTPHKQTFLDCKQNHKEDQEIATSFEAGRLEGKCRGNSIYRFP
ncbi:hypothetical protein [Thermoflavifilum thermophilum]|uniref:hypothetical protein n=1 Tax=Thermoflavifilum thermophilum TaxID=1393122 RepID=UPI000B805DB0|nr:hypothetical protein [Thermoflavifilum thermophilum]